MPQRLALWVDLALRVSETRHAHCGAEFPGFYLLFASNIEGAIEIRFCLGAYIRVGRTT